MNESMKNFGEKCIGDNFKCSLKNNQIALFDYSKENLQNSGKYPFVYLPITFNNPLKACFSNKKYLITILTRPTQIVKVYFLLKTQFSMEF